MEKIIKFSDDEFINACDEDKVEDFKSQYCDGTRKFEITFNDWAEIKKDSQLYKGFKIILKGTNKKGTNKTITKNFYITDNKGNRISNKNTNYFPTKKDFDNINLPNPFDKDSNFIMWSFYAVLFLWCVNISNDNNDNFIEYLNNIESTIEKFNFFGSGGQNYIPQITINGIDKNVHLGVSYDQLLPRTPYILQYLIKHNPDYANYKVIFTPNCESNSTSNGGSNMNDTSKDTNTDINIIKFVEEKIEKYNQIVFTGAPGTGKTYAVSEYVKKRQKEVGESIYEFVQFHPSYDYTDFVEGIRPMPNSNADDKNIFVRVDGIFKKFCRKIVEANNAKDKNNLPTYYFVIDEINRADLSRVFGELMFGLEESYRGEKNAFPTQYQNLPTFEYKKGEGTKKEGTKKIEKDVFENGFYVPENLKIIGMMNDIDRSVETFDFALRRRFVWIDIKANEVMLESVKSINGIDEKSSDKVKKAVEDVVDNIIAMNNVISGDIGSSLGLNESYHIGPAFFKNLYDKDKDGNINIKKNNLETIFAEKIEPQLKEYVRGRSTTKIKDLINECREKLCREKLGLPTGDSNG